MEITLPIIHGTRQNAADNDLLRFKGVQSVRCFGQAICKPHFSTTCRFVDGFIN